MAGYKTISILSLIFVVALAGISPALADDARLVLTPASGCPGTGVEVQLRFTGPLAGNNVISSDPDGLFRKPDPGEFFLCRAVANGETTVTCYQEIAESICPGRYTVTFTIGEESASAVFEVPSTCPSLACEAVGGCVQPVNTFGLVAPWLAVIGLVGCIGTAVVVARKRVK